MKVFKNLFIYILVFGFSVIFFFGCEDYLNVFDDLVVEMIMEEVFNNISYVCWFYCYIYMGIFDVLNIIIMSVYVDLIGLDNFWLVVFDELKFVQNNVKMILIIGYYVGLVILLCWSFYKQI